MNLTRSEEAVLRVEWHGGSGLPGGLVSREEREAHRLDEVAELDRGETVSGGAALGAILAAVAQRLPP